MPLKRPFYKQLDGFCEGAFFFGLGFFFIKPFAYSDVPFRKLAGLFCPFFSPQQATKMKRNASQCKTIYHNVTQCKTMQNKFKKCEIICIF